MTAAAVAQEIVNLDLEGALEAVLEEMRLVEDEDDLEIWEDISCVDLDDFPLLEPVWIDACGSG